SQCLPMRRLQRFVRGLYAGGTLAYEALGILSTRLADVAPGVAGRGQAHRVVDLGEEVFTVGRPHPMLDGTIRREWIEQEAADPATAVLLLDVVLGYGLPLSAAELARLAVPVLDVDWRPPAGGNARLATLLARLEAGRDEVERANARVFDLLVEGRPFLVDCRPAHEALELPERV